MKRVIESNLSDVPDHIEKKPKLPTISNVYPVEGLETVTVSSSSVAEVMDLTPEYIEFVPADESSRIMQDDDSSAVELTTDLLIQYMDITEPLTSLRTLLERRVSLNLSDYQFYLQDVQELDASKNLVNQCVQGEGLVQINVQISHINGIKKINIVDVLKPAEEISVSPSATEELTSRVFLLGDAALTETSSPPKDNSDYQQVTRWVQSTEFRKLQEKHKIPSEPSLWSVEHVRLWLEWATRHFKVRKVDFSDWDITGKELIAMTPEAVKQRIPIDAAELFWTHVELVRKFKMVTVMQTAETTEEEKVGKRKQNQKVISFPKLPYEGSPGNNGQIQLWQFLLELLTDKDFRDFIRWVGTEGEFKLINPEMVAQLWGQRKNKPTMNYEKLSRALRYYYDGEMLAKVHGKRFVYKFVCDLKSLLGYDAVELNKLVTECEMKKNEAYSFSISNS